MPTERRHYGKTDLLFIEPHVDYCVVNKRYGSLGTHHRKCSLTSREGNCEHICCGRSHVTKSIRVREEKCQFRWCCEVICEEREVDKNVTHCLWAMGCTHNCWAIHGWIPSHRVVNFKIITTMMGLPREAFNENVLHHLACISLHIIRNFNNINISGVPTWKH